MYTKNYAVVGFKVVNGEVVAFQSMTFMSREDAELLMAALDNVYAARIVKV